MTDGPSVQNDIWQYYQTLYPGRLQVIGADTYDGTEANLRTFQTGTGATYPLLLRARTGTGGNMYLSYGENDSHQIINRVGIVRYNSNQRYAHFNRYHLAEIRMVIDSLITSVVGVGEGPRYEDLTLSASPNPFRRDISLEVTNPGPASRHARVTVHDVSGRRLVTLWDGPASPGMLHLAWDGRAAGGREMAAGIYLVRVEQGGWMLSRRIVRVP